MRSAIVRPIALAALLLAAGLGPSASPARATGDVSPVVAGAWLEPSKDVTDTLVVGLFLRAGEKARSVFVAFADVSDPESPSDYGTFRAGAWHEVKLAPGELVLAKHPTGTDSNPVLVMPEATKADVQVHDLIDEGGKKGAILFEVVGGYPQVTFDRHVAEVGEVVKASLPAPDGEGFFTDRTMEIVSVARRLAVNGSDPSGPGGFVSVEVESPDETDDAAFRLLQSQDGETRIRSHFENPKCDWAERHVRWMADRWILEYRRPEVLKLALDTTPVRAAGRVSDMWNGYTAISQESIYPNGFGGTTTGLDLPCLIVVPKGTKTRTEPL